jgi:hypothetical protein
MSLNVGMLLQYASDLHIDGWPADTPYTTFLTPSAPHLILAGDVCSAWDPRYFRFLKWAGKHWQTVLVIAGNHEYHNTKRHTIAETDARIFDYCLKRNNIIYLQHGMSYTIPGTSVRVVGATLWCAPDQTMWKKGAKKKGDYRMIYMDTPEGKRRFHPSDVSFLHILQKALIAWAIQPQYEHETVVVATHYIPTKRLLEPKFRGEEWHSFYASDDDDLLTANVALWICGHGHRGTTLQVEDGPLLAMNARGYNRESELARAADLYNPAALQKVI